MEYLLFSFVLIFFLIIAFLLNLVIGCQLALIKGKYTHIIYLYIYIYTHTHINLYIYIDDINVV